MDRVSLDRLAAHVMKAFAALTCGILIFIVAGLFWKSSLVLSQETLGSLLFSSVWKPSKGMFGFYPFITSTVIVTFFAMVFSIPVCLMSAIYLTEYSSRAVRSAVKAAVDALAGIPSIIFGLWGVLFIVPLVRDSVAPALGAVTSGYCILSGALVLALMVVPIMLSIMQEVMMSVPADLRESSFTLGATRWQTMKHVVLPKTAGGIFSAVILGFSRAFGETMAVLMVVGNVAMQARSPFDPVYPLTALIANNYGEMLSVPTYESAIMFGALILLLIVAAFNIAAKKILDRIKAEAY